MMGRNYISALFLWALVTEMGALLDEHVQDKPLMCKRQTKVECDVDTCLSDEVECYHGTCSQHTGNCVCFPCWTGDSCDFPENPHIPRFEQHVLKVDFNIEDIHKDDAIVKVLAQDPDAGKCAHADTCPCAYIMYSIEEGNENGIFMIDSKDGLIQLSDKAKAKPEHEVATFKLKVSAKNPFYGKKSLKAIDSSADDTYDTASSVVTVQILLRPGEKTEHGIMHSRKRRSVATGIPEEEIFTLQKLPPFTNTTDIRIGEPVSIRLTIWLPVQTTNMSVELLAPYESSALMVLCNPNFTYIGSNYQLFNVVPQYYAHGNDSRYNRVLINLGSVTNNGKNNGTNTTDDNPNKIHLDFNVILQDNNATRYGDNYTVSVRVSYGREHFSMWVEEVTLTTVNDTDDWPLATPQIAISGPSNLTTHTLAIFDIDLVLKNYVTNFYIDVVAAEANTSNPVLKICEFQLAGKGENYGCMPNELPEYTSVKDNVGDSTISARLFFGKVVNTGLRDGNSSDAANSLSMEARVYITNSSDNVHGGIYWVNATLTMDGTKTYSSQHAVTVLTTPAPSMNADPTIQLYTVDGNSVTIGGSVGFMVAIDIPENTTSVYTVDLFLPYTPADGSVLAICRAEVVYVGHNIPCMGNVNLEINRQDGKNADSVKINLGGITNLGRRTQIDDNRLKILCTSELLAGHSDVSDGMEFNVTAEVSYKGATRDKRLVSHVTVTAVDYQHHEYAEPEKLPKFSLINRDADYFLYKNSAVSFNITITVPPGTTYTPFVIGISGQKGMQNDSPMIGICRVEVVKIGSDLYCYNLDKVSMTNTSSTEGVTHEYLVDLGVVTNSLEPGLQKDPQDSAIAVEVIMYWVNHQELVHNQDVTVTVKATYGSNKTTWNASVGYIARFDRPQLQEPLATPQITISGPSNLTTHTLAIFDIDLVLKNYVTDFYIDVVAAEANTSNPVLKICEFQLAGKGENYGCMPNELPEYTSVKDNVSGSTISARLFFGKVVNTGLRDGNSSDAANSLSMEARVYITNSSDNVHGGKYWVNATLTMDGTKTYSSQHAVTVLTTPAPSMNADPTIQLYTVNGNSVTIGGSVGFMVAIDIPENTTSVYTVDLSMPYTPADGSVLAICRTEVVYVGHNIPCMGNVNLEINRQDGKNADSVKINLGGITNLGRRTQTDDNRLKILCTSELLADHSDVSDGMEFNVTAEVSYKGATRDKRLVSHVTVTAVDYQHHEYAEPEKLPKFSLINRDADYFLYKNSAVSFNITITVPPGTTYTPFVIGISGQKGMQNDSPMIGICRVEVVKIGSDLYCYNLDKVSMTNTSSTEGVTHEYLVDLGVVTNSLEPGLQKDPQDSAIAVEVIMYWVNHQELVHNQDVTVTVKATYGSNKTTWNASVGYIARFDRPQLQEDDERPQFEFILGHNSSLLGQNSSLLGRNGSLRPGNMAVYELTILTPLNSKVSYQVDVSSSTLGICRSQLISVGRNIPCFSTDRSTQYLSSKEDGRQDKAVLDIGPVKNIGFKPVSDAKDNAIVVQMVVKLDAVVATVHEFKVTVGDGNTVLYTASKQIEAGVTQDDINSTKIPAVRFTKLDAESAVIVGGAAVFNLDFYIPYGSAYDYKVQFFSNQTDLYRTTLCEARLIQSGWNIPCINGTLLTTIYNSTTGDGHYDTAYIDVGTVANMIIDGDSVISESNKVRVQLVAQLENTTIMENEQFWLSAVLTVNRRHMQYLRVSFNATYKSNYSENLPQPQFQITRSYGPAYITTGSTKTFYLKITTPIMSAPMAITIIMPSALNEAYLTISGIQLIRIGVNYACHHVYELKPVYSSTHSTSQKNHAYVYLGIVTNHGTTHHYQYNPEYLRPEDDEILLSLKVQLADHSNFVYGHVTYTGARFAVDFSFNSPGGAASFHEIVHVVVTGDEGPVVGFNISMYNHDPAITKQGDLVLTELSIYHTAASSSHAYNPVVNLMLPYYLEVDENVEIKGSPVSVKTSEAGVEFHLARMFFTDIFTLRFNISVDPHRLMPIDEFFINTTVPVDIIYYKMTETNGQGNMVSGKIFKTETIIIDLTFRTEQECFDALGIEDNSTVKDCQITASSFLNNTYTPQMARLNSKSGWAPVVRDMKPYKGSDYLETRFGGLHRFTGVRMQKAFNSSNSVKTFRLSYSRDGIVWNDYHHIFTNEYNKTANDTSSMNVIHVPFNAAYIRIHPLSHFVNTTFPALRIELYGCKRTTTIDLNAACTTTESSGYPYYERGFMVEPESGSVFVCILEYVSGPTRCSYSLDNGTTWEAMDNNVANVVGFDPETKELFGLSQNRRAIMRSGNLGVTWSSTDPERYLALSNSSYLTQAVAVPFEEISEKPAVTMASQGDSFFYEWGAAAKGLYRREVILTQGNSTPSDWQLIGLWGYP